MSDPNGWVTQPPATMVKVVNTSRDVLNGKLGIVLAYQSDRGRYVVLMTVTQEQVSLKPDNLVKGSWTEQLQAQFEIMQNNPQVQQQIRSIYNRVQTATGVKPEYVAAAAGLALLALFYLVGFSRVMMVISFCLLVGILVQPDIQAGATPQQMARNAPRRFKEMIRQNVPMVGDRIANSDILTGLAAGLILFFFVNALVGGRKAPAPPATTTGSSYNHVATTTKRVADRALLEEYYKLGFDDGQAGKDFGSSLPAVEPKGVDPDYSWPGSDYVPPTTSSSLLSKFTNWSSLLSLYVVGSTLVNAGRTADGGFDPSLMLANLRMLDPWKQGMLALSVYRLVAPLFSS